MIFSRALALSAICVLFTWQPTSADVDKRPLSPEDTLRLRAEAIVQKNRIRGELLDNFVKSQRQLGRKVLTPGPDRPTGRITLPERPYTILEGNLYEFEVKEWKVELSESTDNRFVLVTNSSFHRAGKRLSASMTMQFGSRSLANNGLPMTTTQSCRFSQPGKYELLIILSAQPVNGDNPVLLDVKVVEFEIIDTANH